MNKILLTALLGSGLYTSSFALTQIYDKDWVDKGTRDGTINIEGASNWNMDLAQNVTFKFYGVTKSSLAGVYQFHANGESSYRKFLCVQLDADSANTSYEYKAVSGYAGWLVKKIGDIANADQGAALGLLTWEIAYDSGYAAKNWSTLNFANGNFKYTASGNILNLANDYLNEFKADDTLRNYVYYHNPYGGCNEDKQDFIGTGTGYHENGEPTVPGPLAALPFAVGFALSMRRRK